MPKPPTVVDLRWTRDLVFEATSGAASLTVDGDSTAGPSPVQALAISIAGCMAADLAAILTKGRHPFHVLTAHLVADRAQDNPHRIVRLALQFVVEGAAPNDAVARAIELSRERYCSVWHSLRQDIAFTTGFEIRP